MTISPRVLTADGTTAFTAGRFDVHLAAREPEEVARQVAEEAFAELPGQGDRYHAVYRSTGFEVRSAQMAVEF
ncbi:MAG: hypothetical protein ABWY11_09495 [Umezawaea sp.]